MQIFFLKKQFFSKNANFLPHSKYSFVLKPQREGGGNNVYGYDIPSAIQVSDQLPPAIQAAYQRLS